jgi:hypothetical protein
MRIILTIFAVLLMAGCAANRAAYYSAQSDYRAKVSADNAGQREAVASTAASCSDDTCRVAVAAIAALTRPERIEAPRQYRSEAGSWLGLVDRALGIGAQAYGARMSRDTLLGVAGVIADSAGDRSTHSFIDQSDHSDNSTSIVDSFNAGDTIADSGNTTTTISDSGNGNAGRDVIGRDRTDNSGNIGTDNRIGSDGPISDDGNDCSGSSCNPVEPDPEG